MEHQFNLGKKASEIIKREHTSQIRKLRDEAARQISLSRESLRGETSKLRAFVEKYLSRVGPEENISLIVDEKGLEALSGAGITLEKLRSKGILYASSETEHRTWDPSSRDMCDTLGDWNCSVSESTKALGTRFSVQVKLCPICTFEIGTQEYGKRSVSIYKSAEDAETFVIHIVREAHTRYSGSNPEGHEAHSSSTTKYPATTNTEVHDLAGLLDWIAKEELP